MLFKRIRDLSQEIIAGFLFLLTSVFAFGVFRDGFPKIFEFANENVHKWVARTLLNGQLYVNPFPQLGVPHDFEFYNGAVFTHWGLGVPFLELPFHALNFFVLRRFGFQPLAYDRMIYLFYLCVVSILFFCSIRKLLNNRLSECTRLEKNINAYLISFVTFTFTIYWLCSLFFRTYEATVAYFVLVQLAALSFYILYKIENKALYLVLMISLASFGILVRQTGLLYFGVWIAIVLNKKNLKPILFSSFPFISFWLFFNYLKTGNPFSFGFENAFSRGDEFHTLRFSNPCFDDITNYYRHSKIIFGELFGTFTPYPNYFAENLPDSLKNCGIFIEETGGQRAPLIGPGVLTFLLAAVGYTMVKKRKFAIGVAFLGLLTLFIGFSHAAAGFGIRYAGDFWPLIALCSIEFIRNTSIQKHYLTFFIVLTLFFSYSLLRFKDEIIPQFVSIEARQNLDQVQRLAGAYTKEKLYAFQKHARIPESTIIPESSLSPKDRSLISNERRCGDTIFYQLELDMFGWNRDCSTWSLSNFFIGVPKKNDKNYTLTLETDGKEISKTIQVYVNGKTYTSRILNGKSAIPIKLNYKELYSSVIAVTVEWDRTFKDSSIRFLKASLN
ncbi:MAG: hypothetical protein AB7F43_00725 [Bacteriovoracia bacterium]